MLNYSISLDEFGTRKSFYGKARVEVQEDSQIKTLTLFSYDTEIMRAKVDAKTNACFALERLWDGCTATTLRHIAAFMLLLELPYGGKKWWDSFTTWQAA